MADKTGIEWTDATWNPVRGCTRVSEGCRNCYAKGVAYRFSGPGQPYEGLVRIGADGERRREWNGVVRFVEEHLLDPLRWKKPRRIFVNSMSDLFHEGVTDEQLDRIFAVMALCPQHTFQVLTKRPERMRDYLMSAKTRHDLTVAAECTFDYEEVPDARMPYAADNLVQWPLPNVWLGVSIENQAAADKRIPLLLKTPAAVRFLSCEPLLGPIDLTDLCAHELSRAYGRVADAEELEEPWKYSALEESCIYWGGSGDIGYGPDHGKVDWVIVGGESGSGPGIRPMHPDWVRGLRDQCVAAGVPFFFKQWGEWLPWEPDGGYSEWKSYDATIFDNDSNAVYQRVGKKSAGDLLDGKQWHEFPEVRA